jgi:apolipoprotein N-acyltransferase
MIYTAVKSITLRQVIFRTYGIFLTTGLIAISWIAMSGMRDNADPFLIIGGIFTILVYPLFFIPPIILFYYINRNLPSERINPLTLLSFPFLWTGFEYLQTLGQINFPWLFAGNSQTYNLSNIQYAEYTGVFGVSFWICLSASSVYFLVDRISFKQPLWTSMKSIATTLVIINIFLFPHYYNLLIKKTYPDEGYLKVGIVQPNTDPWKKWTSGQNELILGYIEQIREIHSQNQGLDLILLPETAIPTYFREDYFRDRLELLQSLCDSINIPFIIGTPDKHFYDDNFPAPNDAKILKRNGKKYDNFNTAVLFEPGMNKDNFQKHQKIKLVIGSERMPYQELLPFSKSLIEWGVGLSSWQIGQDTNIFELKDGIKFNTAICYESVYPEFFADFVNRGAQFCVIITNDGWWGKFFGTYQHNRFAVFRAIENRRWIARCANTGISDFIDPEGNFFEETPINERANIVYDIGLRNEKTFFTMHGDLFAKICLTAGVLLFALSFVLRRRNK